MMLHTVPWYHLLPAVIIHTFFSDFCDFFFFCNHSLNWTVLFRFFWQAYIVDNTPTESGSIGGFDYTGRPEGIPSLEEYLAVYCSLSVYYLH